MWYKLDSEGNPIQCSGILEYEEWFMKHGSTVAQSKFRDTKNVEIYVSTVFLGLDHSNTHNSKVPILWETMVFGGQFDQQLVRYSSSKHALEGHNVIIEGIKNDTTTDITCISEYICKNEIPIDEKDLFKNVLQVIKYVK